MINFDVTQIKTFQNLCNSTNTSENTNLPWRIHYSSKYVGKNMVCKPVAHLLLGLPRFSSEHIHTITFYILRQTTPGLIETNINED